MSRAAMLAGAFASIAFTRSNAALAAPPPPAAPVDVAIATAPLAPRPIVLELNPLPLFTIGKLSLDLLVVPDDKHDHEALVLNGFVTSTSTVPIYLFDDTSVASGTASSQAPKQTFRGVGAEIGYRHYYGPGGLRGAFLGPSLVLAGMSATAQDGTSTHYFDLGLAFDGGYQALVSDRLSITLGAGLQYLFTTTSIPDQQYPAKIYATRGFLPRALASVGWAF